MPDQPLIENKDAAVEELAKHFTMMATRILLNKNDKFGGALVIVPPEGGGDPIETLVLDVSQDPAQFWSIVKSKAELTLQALDMAARSQQAFRR